MDRKDWSRLGLATAAALLVPGGFLLGAVLLARRQRKIVEDEREAGETGTRQDVD